MSKYLSRVLMALVLAVTISSPELSWAKNDRHDERGRGKYERDHRLENARRHDRRYDVDRERYAVFNDIDRSSRVAIERRLETYYDRKCPPGLAKKYNGCLPPGHTKHYAIGRPLPSYVEYWAVPQEVIMLLPSAPAHTQYVLVDRDVLLISEASRKVIDALVWRQR